ncbi:RNA-binding protein [bacterium]|nr:RNA-binding protein [bacterium]
MSSKKIFVGNIAHATQQDQLQSHFASIGAVTEAKIITDRDTGRSKGFGFVEMESEELAVEAVEKLNGQELDGRPLRLDFAKEQQRRSGGGGGGFRGGRGGGGGFRGGRGGGGGGY